jgi:hypothetical protein
MDALQRLLDIEELRILKANYFYNLDHKLWDDWIALFTEDTVLKVDSVRSIRDGEGGPTRIFEGAAAVVEFVSKHSRSATAETVHHGHTFQYGFLSDTEAWGRWAMQDIVDHKDGLLKGYGHYRETYRKVDGRWKFSSVHLTPLRIEWTPRSTDNSASYQVMPDGSS